MNLVQGCGISYVQSWILRALIKSTVVFSAPLSSAVAVVVFGVSSNVSVSRKMTFLK